MQRFHFDLIVKYFHKFSWRLFYRWRFASLGANSFIEKALKLTPNCIHCGNNVFIFKNCRIEGVVKYNSQHYSPKINFQDNVSVQQNLHLTCANSITIGKNTAIAANVTITDIHHPYENIKIPIEMQDITVKPVNIGEDCKIYNNVVILPGTVIGKHCSIGANSVVSGKFLDYCVVVGAPAKIIKRYSFEHSRWEKTHPDGSFIN